MEIDSFPDALTLYGVHDGMADARIFDQLLETPQLQSFVEGFSPVVQDFTKPRKTSVAIAPPTLTDKARSTPTPTRAQPMQAGLLDGLAVGSDASANSTKDANACGEFNVNDPRLFPDIDFESDLQQFEFHQNLTEGLTASPDCRKLQLDRSAFASDIGDNTYLLPPAHATGPVYEKPVYEKSYFVTPNHDDLAPSPYEDKSTVLTGLGIDLNPDNAGFGPANLDNFNYQGPPPQLSLTTTGAARKSAGPVYDAMQEVLETPAPQAGSAQQDLPPVRLQPKGQFNLTVPSANKTLSVPRLARAQVIPQAFKGSEKVAAPIELKTRPKQPIPAGFKKEQAKLPREKSWVRVNDRMGANNRGGKLNEYDPEQFYTKVPAPMSWTVNDYVFNYSEDGELSEDYYSAEQLDAYLRFYDQTRAAQGYGKLRVWIQKTPADCARRYATPSSSECRFKDCPLRQVGKRATIWQGHLRVAFDENYDTYCKGTAKSGTSQVIDPFANAGYCHLYCFERFLDLPSLLDVVTVKLDSRNIDTEPNGNYPCRLDPNDALDGRYDAAVAFMAVTSKGRLLQFPRKYPSHQSSKRNIGNSEGSNGVARAKPHNATLNGAMQQAYINSWAAPKLRTMRDRNASTSLLHTFGDLELYCAAKWPKHWRALRRGEDPRKVKEAPKYARGSKGYSRKGSTGIKGAGRRKRRRVEYESDTEDESDDEDLQDADGEDEDDDSSDSPTSLSDDESEDDRPVRKARKLTSTKGPKVRNHEDSDEEGPVIHVKTSMRQPARRDSGSSSQETPSGSSRPRRSLRSAAKHTARHHQ